MKKTGSTLIINIFLFAFFAIAPLSAGEKNWTISLSPHTGFTSGVFEENLYSSSDENIPVSLLEWKEKFFWNFGLTAAYSYKDFSVEGDFSFYVPAGCGEMIDSDFDGETVKNICYFDNTSGFSFDASLDLKYRFKPSELNISPVIKLYYSKRNFSSENGYGYFEGRKASKVSDIIYRHDNFCTFTGCQFDFAINRFAITASFFISPFSVCSAYDQHKKLSGEESYYTYTVMTSYFNNFLAELSLSFQISKSLSAFVSISGLITTYNKEHPLTNYGRSETYGEIFGNEDYISRQKTNCCIKEFKIKTGCQFNF